MALTVNTNLSAMQAYQNLSRTTTSMANSMAKLSSGLRINTAADDAAGLTISEGLKAQVNGYGIAARNAQDGINLIQTADGALGEVHSVLQRMRDLAVQGANDSNNETSRGAIEKEALALGKELGRIIAGTNFNGIQLLDGSVGGTAAAGTLTFQVGAGGSDNDKIDVTFADVKTWINVSSKELSGADTATSLAGFKVTDTASGDGSAAQNARDTIVNIDAAIKGISDHRANLGAAQNRMTHAMNIANISAQNLAASQSHITDTDMAQEMVRYTKDSILSQAGTAMLAQANQSGQGILKLLG